MALFLICLWRREDSNLRPLGYEPNELPTALPRYVKNQQSRPTHFCINRLCGSVVNNLFYLTSLVKAVFSYVYPRCLATLLAPKFDYASPYDILNIGKDLWLAFILFWHSLIAFNAVRTIYWLFHSANIVLYIKLCKCFSSYIIEFSYLCA